MTNDELFNWESLWQSKNNHWRKPLIIDFWRSWALYHFDDTTSLMEKVKDSTMEVTVNMTLVWTTTNLLRWTFQKGHFFFLDPYEPLNVYGKFPLKFHGLSTLAEHPPLMFALTLRIYFITPSPVAVVLKISITLQLLESFNVVEN